MIESMPKQLRPSSPKRGEIYLVNFDPTIGAEIRKTRPALIIQNNVANRYSPITIVAAITSRAEESLYPTEIAISRQESGLEHDSVVLLNQIRSMDKKRLIKRVGALRQETMERVNPGLELSLGLIE